MIIHDSNHLQECVFCDKKISDFIDDEKMMKMFKKDILYHMFNYLLLLNVNAHHFNVPNNYLLHCAREGIYYYVPDEGKYYFAPDEVQAR